MDDEQKAERPERTLADWRAATRAADEAQRALTVAKLESASTERVAEQARRTADSTAAAAEQARQTADMATAAAASSMSSLSERQADVDSARDAEETARERHHEVTDRAYEQRGYGTSEPD